MRSLILIIFLSILNISCEYRPSSFGNLFTIKQLELVNNFGEVIKIPNGKRIQTEIDLDSFNNQILIKFYFEGQYQEIPVKYRDKDKNISNKILLKAKKNLQNYDIEIEFENYLENNQNIITRNRVCNKIVTSYLNCLGNNCVPNIKSRLGIQTEKYYFQHSNISVFARIFSENDLKATFHFKEILGTKKVYIENSNCVIN